MNSLINGEARSRERTRIVDTGRKIGATTSACTIATPAILITIIAFGMINDAGESGVY